MAREQQYNNIITEFDSVLHTDNDPSSQPKGTHRFALNTINEAKDGQQKTLSNEMSSYSSSSRPTGYEIIGDRYIGDDSTVLILTNPTTGQDEIALINKDNKYYTQVNTGVLNLSITNQCDIRFRIRKGKERVIYWVDANNRPRTFNLDRPQNFFNQTYKAYLQGGGDPNTFIGEKWDTNSFNLQKTTSIIPTFDNVEIIETGNILPGSLNFAIQLIDEDLNPTEWIATTNTINIYNDSTSLFFAKIRGSRNTNTNNQSFSRTNKSVRLTISNLDTSFPFYRIAIIRAAGNTGTPEKVLVSELFSTFDGNFLYTGNDDQLSDIALENILIDKEIIFAPKHIEQIEQRLILANTKGKGINWCEFQQYASKISSDLVTKEVILNDIASQPNVKNAKSTFLFRGNMPGEVYSYAIVYGGDDFISPSFHIPGRSASHPTSQMKFYENDNRYLDVHNCSLNNYWGVDSEGNALLGEKQRHHRFPFRKEVGKSLYGSTGGTTTINKYRVKVTFTLNPAWTPGPIAYPTTASIPDIIPYGLKYQITSSPSTTTYSGVLQDTDMGVQIIIYDDVNPLSTISGPDYILLDPTSDLATLYQSPGNDRFIISHVYETYSVTSPFTQDKSEIFGIEFSNIEKPHPEVKWFYIVRNERLDDDKLIIDNAIFGAMTEYQQYKSFGLLQPRQYYHVDNCGRPGDSGKTLGYYNKGVWFFNPEFEYFGRKSEYDAIEVEGTYTQNVLTMPTISNNAGSSCNGGSGANGGSKGVYINDVQAGTSYDPAINKKKDKDDDGFDLIVGYRNTTFSYAINNTFVFPIKKKILYLDPTAYQDLSGEAFYNTSVDNKIGMYLFDANTISTNLFYNPATKKTGLLYGSLVKNNTAAYSNFITRPYYKEHNNPIMFTSSTINNIEIFNGDAQISAFNFVSSVFYDMVVANRAKKNNLWKIIVGAIFGGGLITGIPNLIAEIQRLQSMTDIDYEKGLKETVTDGGVFETLRTDLEREDDTIRWFTDRLSNVYIESSVPFGLRSGYTTGLTDFINAPAPYDEPEFRTYITEKFTSLDRNQGSGRLYKGYASPEFYDMNKDYMRFNKEKEFIHLNIQYDCCSDSNEIFPLRRWPSQQSFQEEIIDNYGIFLPNNYSDMEGEHGEITNMYRLGNNLFIHTKEGLWQQPVNIQERITDEIVSFIGTGEFFQIPSRKTVDDDLGAGGTQHKWATIKTKHGVLFVDEIEHKVYRHAEGLRDITEGNRNWFKNNLKSFLSEQLYINYGIDFLLNNNPTNSNGVGYISTYDTRYERVLITKRDYLLLPNKLEILTIVSEIPTIPSENFVYCTLNGLFYLGNVQILLSNDLYFQNKSWTISYSFDANKTRGGFISWHSYIPNYYIHSKNSLYTILTGDARIWKHHLEGNFQTFFGVYHPYIVESVVLYDVLDKMIEELVLYTKARTYDNSIQDYIDSYFTTFNKILLYNSRQSTGEQSMIVKDTQVSPQDWYQQQITNVNGSILITRKGRNWNINNFRDYVDDYTIPLFSANWSDIKATYFIDKIVNPTTINLNKSWEQLLSFRDKYIVIRLKFDIFDNVNLILNYSLETEQTSNR